MSEQLGVDLRPKARKAHGLVPYEGESYRPRLDETRVWVDGYICFRGELASAARAAVQGV
jgi:hypothetical protein